MNKNRSDKIVGRLRDYYGKLSPSLHHKNLYQLTISVVLSAQTTDIQVNQVSRKLFKSYPDFKSLAKADIGVIENLIRSTGFYRVKARNIVNLSRAVLDRFNGILPTDRQQLMSLPGIGRKSANVIIALGFQKPAFAVDTHIGRVSKRIGYSDSDDPLKVEKDVVKIIPEVDLIECHLLFINHGRSICKARKPLCGRCPVSSLCDFANNTA